MPAEADDSIKHLTILTSWPNIDLSKFIVVHTNAFHTNSIVWRKSWKKGTWRKYFQKNIPIFYQIVRSGYKCRFFDCLAKKYYTNDVFYDFPKRDNSKRLQPNSPKPNSPNSNSSKNLKIKLKWAKNSFTLVWVLHV